MTQNGQRTILMKAVAADRRYLPENMAILDPTSSRVKVSYRQVWIHPPLQREIGARQGKDALIVFFDFETRLLEAVRSCQILDVAQEEGLVTLSLQLGDFVSTPQPLGLNEVPRLPDEGFGTKELAPKDGKGRHAFVFDAPPKWSAVIDHLTLVRDEQTWIELLRKLASPENSPYRACRFVFISRDGGLTHAREEKPLEVGADGAPRVKVWAFSGDMGLESHAVRVRMVAYADDQVLWSVTQDIESGSCVAQAIDIGNDLRARAGAAIRLEAFAVEQSRFSRHCLLGLKMPGAAVSRASGPPGRTAEWTRALSHVNPRSEAQLETCRQLISGIYDHDLYDTAVVDAALSWGLPEEAMRLLRAAPQLWAEAGQRQLAVWLRAFSEAPLESRLDVFRNTLTRIERSAASAELLDGLLSFLEAQSDSNVFWRCLNLRQAWEEAGRRAENIALCQALLLEGQAVDLARFADLLVHNRHSLRSDERRAAVDVLSFLGRDEPSRALELTLAEEGVEIVDWGRLFRSASAGDVVRALPWATPAAAYEPVASWYRQNQGRSREWPPGLWSDLLLWLAAAAEVMKVAQTESEAWVSEVARCALEQKDWFLLLWLAVRAADIGNQALRGEVEAALSTMGAPAADALEGARRTLAGKRVLIVGVQYAPDWTEALKSTLGVTVECKVKERGSTYDKKDFPASADWCAVLKWAGHAAFERAREVYGTENVHFVQRPGLRSVQEALVRWAGTKG